MKLYHISKLKLATLIAKNESKRLTGRLIWVISVYSKHISTQKSVGDPVLMVGSNYEIPGKYIEIKDCYYRGRKQTW
jgi:hypothetical protein